MSFLLHTDKPEPVFKCEYVPDDNGGSNTPGEDGKTPILQAGIATSLDPGLPPTVALPQSGVDDDGNPIYVLNVGIPKGAPGNDGASGSDGKTPVFQDGEATAMAPEQPVTMRLSQTGTDANGNPIYALNLGVPVGKQGDKGDPGEDGEDGADGKPGISGIPKSGIYREPGSAKDLPDLPAFADTAEGDEYIVDDDAVPGQYDLYIHGIGGTDWDIVQNWGGVPGQDGEDGVDGKDGTDGVNGKTPVIQGGTATGLAAGASPTVQLVPSGIDANGNPVYILNFGIPKGDKGDGNLQADPTGIVAGKQYAFVPNTDGSTTGTLQEVVAPSTPSTPDNFLQDVTDKFNTNSSARFIARKTTSIHGGQPVIELFGEDTSGSDNELVITPEFGFGPDNSNPIAVNEYANPADATTTQFKVLVESETSVERGKLTVPNGCPKFELKFFQGVEDIELTFNIPGATPETITKTVPVRQEFILPSAEDLGFTAMPAGQAFDYWEATAGAGQVTSITPTADGTHNFVGKLVAVVQGETRIIVTANLNSTTAAVFEQQADGTKTKLHDFQLQYPLFDGGLWASPSGKYIYTTEANGSRRSINRYIRGVDDNFTFESILYEFVAAPTFDIIPLTDDNVVSIRKNAVTDIFVYEHIFDETSGTWSYVDYGNVTCGNATVFPTISHLCALVDTPQMGQLIFVPTLIAGKYALIDVAAQTITAKDRYSPGVAGTIKQFFATRDGYVGAFASLGVPTNPDDKGYYDCEFIEFDLTGTDITVVVKQITYSLLNPIRYSWMAGHGEASNPYPLCFTQGFPSGTFISPTGLDGYQREPAVMLSPVRYNPRIQFSPIGHKLLVTQQTSYPYAQTLQINADGSYTQQPTASGSPTAPCAACWVPNVTS